MAAIYWRHRLSLGWMGSGSVMGCSNWKRGNRHHFFNKSNSMTIGVLVFMLCFKFAGMWTQVPGCASTVSSPSANVASP